MREVAKNMWKEFEDIKAAQEEAKEFEEIKFNKSSTYEDIKADIKRVDSEEVKIKELFAHKDEFNFKKLVIQHTDDCIGKNLYGDVLCFKAAKEKMWK